MITLPLPYFIVNRFSQNTCEEFMKKNVPWHILAPRRGCFSNHLPLRRVRILIGAFLSYGNKVSYTMKKKQPHREGFVPDTAVLISVYYVRSDSAAPDQIMATPAFDCGACSDT